MNLDVGQLLTLLESHAWIAAAALVIGFIVRLTKDDALVPIPAKYRAWLATALGIASGTLNALLVPGTPLLQAIVTGLTSAFTAISGHELLVEGLRGGREFFWHGTAKGEPKHPYRTNEPPTPPAPPVAMRERFTFGAVILACATLLFAGMDTGCHLTPAQTADDVHTVLDVVQYACIIANADLPSIPAVETACDLDATFAPAIETVIDDYKEQRTQWATKTGLLPPAPPTAGPRLTGQNPIH